MSDDKISSCDNALTVSLSFGCSSSGFVGLKGHEMFCEVERSYIEDGFNLYGLRACVSNFSDCLDLILDRIGPDDSDDSHLTQNACTLYGLIHARYIITAHGLDAMYNKVRTMSVQDCMFACLFAFVDGNLISRCSMPQRSLEHARWFNVRVSLYYRWALKDEIGADTVKIFCPKCQCVYHPPVVRHRSHHGSAGNGGVDGASFGTTFPHLFLMTFSNLVPDPLPANSSYVPRVFGFRVHPSAHQRNVPPSPSPAQSGCRVKLENETEYPLHPAMLQKSREVLLYHEKHRTRLRARGNNRGR